MTIQACFACGSTDLEVPKFKDGIVPETDNLGAWVCNVCGEMGIPLEFEHKANHEAFVASLEQPDS